MISRWRWILGLLTRRLWFRAALYGVAAIATALVAAEASPLVPERLHDVLGADSLESILNIVASSMLAVATFSLGTMVAAFAAAASTATPRASKLLIEDPISQNVLSTFLGAFIFALVAIIALGTSYYGAGGRVILFAVLLLVILAVLVTFFRWIDYLSNLGRLNHTLEKVEKAADDAMCVRWNNPHLRCTPLRSIPVGSFPLSDDAIGYVQHLDVASLAEVAKAAKGQVHVARLPGAFVDPTEPVLWTSWQPDDDERSALLKAFVVGRARSFEQDPRFGLIVLSEIASRSLSPAVNDPGTAIDVIGRMVRVLSVWARDPEARDDAVRYPEVFVPPVEIEDLFDDSFGPVARDGAGTIEVGMRLQKALRTLSRVSPTRFGAAAARHSALALRLADEALVLDEQKRVLRSLADEVGAG